MEYEKKQNPTGKIRSITETTVNIDGTVYQLGEKQKQYWKNYHPDDYVAYNHRNGVTTWLAKADTNFSTPSAPSKSYAPKAEVKPFVLTEELDVMDELMDAVQQRVSIWESKYNLKFDAAAHKEIMVSLYIEKNKRR